MTFYRKDFIEDGNKHTFMIKSNQLKGLKESSQFKGIISGLILNWRKTNHTYFLSIDKANKLIENSVKKSFNENEVIENGGYLIEQTLKKVNYTYNIQKFIDDMQQQYNYKGE
jgi:penicillin-binding protein-related factor A (putative recombinase)